MAEPAPAGRGKWLWIVVIVVLLVVLVAWLIRPAGEDSEIAADAPATQSTEWAVEPEGPKVPVTLPDTPMTNTPATDAPGE